MATRIMWDLDGVKEKGVENADEVLGLLLQCAHHYRDIYPVEVAAGHLDVVREAGMGVCFACALARVWYVYTADCAGKGIRLDVKTNLHLPSGLNCVETICAASITPCILTTWHAIVD